MATQKKKAPAKKAKVVKVEDAKYRVLVDFRDDHDGGHIYRIGDVYPRKSSDPSDERVAYLKGNKNRFGIPIIK